MENYVILALVVIAFWVVGFGVYLVVSNKQIDLETEIEHIDSMLDDVE